MALLLVYMHNHRRKNAHSPTFQRLSSDSAYRGDKAGVVCRQDGELSDSDGIKEHLPWNTLIDPLDLGHDQQ